MKKFLIIGFIIIFLILIPLVNAPLGWGAPYGSAGVMDVTFSSISQTKTVTINNYNNNWITTNVIGFDGDQTWGEGWGYLKSLTLNLAGGTFKTLSASDIKSYNSDCGSGTGSYANYLRLPSFGCQITLGNWYNIKSVTYTLVPYTYACGSKTCFYSKVRHTLTALCYLNPDGTCRTCPCTGGNCCDLTTIPCNFIYGQCGNILTCPADTYSKSGNNCTRNHYGTTSCKNSCPGVAIGGGINCVCPTDFSCCGSTTSYPQKTCDAQCQSLNGCYSSIPGTCSNNATGTICAGGTGICDGLGTCLTYSIGNVYWQDTAGTGNKINKTNLSDTVILVAESTADNQQINFIITSPCKNVNKLSQVSGGKATATWKAEYCDRSRGNWTINANIVNYPSISKVSDVLEVGSRKDNSPIIVNILSPTNRQILPIENIISFNQSSYDDDNLWNWTWNFGDGNTNSINYNTTHKYEEGGPKTVTLTVKSGEDTEYSSSSQSIKILINSSVNDAPLAYISSPEEGIQFNALINIFFNASLSTDAESPVEDLNFTWNFGDENISIYHGSSTVWHTFKNVPGPTTFDVILTVTDPQELKDDTTVKVSITPSLYYCIGTNVPLNKCGKDYGMGDNETWCSPNRILMENCSACSYCGSIENMCNKNNGKCFTPIAVCNPMDENACNDKPECYWNGSKCISCAELRFNYVIDRKVGCAIYSQQADCESDKCQIASYTNGLCIFSKNGCAMQLLSPNPKCSVNGVRGYCLQEVNCDNEMYNVSCTTSNGNILCCDTCEFTRMSLDGIACGGAAGISAVMPLFEWPQLMAAILVIAIYYAFYLRNVNIRKMI